MKMMESAMEIFTGTESVEALTELLRANDREFLEEERAYKEALALLKKELPASRLEMYIGARRSRLAASLLYAAYEGYRVNLGNYYSPYSLPCEVREADAYISRHFPGFSETEEICESFRKNLPACCYEAEECVDEFFSLLEVAGPKISHYLSYMLCNRLLPWLVPGYGADGRQTRAYQRELEAFLGYLPT